MQFEPEQLYHIYNRGNNRQRIFFSRENYFFFLQKMRRHLLPHCDILCYCLMPNHFHFLVSTKTESESPTWSGALADNTASIHPLSKAIGILLSSYTRAIQKQEERTGSLFQRHTKEKCLTNHNITATTETANHPFICFNYIHQNPMTAGFVEKIEDWEFSSFKDYIGHRNGSLCNQTLAIQLIDLPKDTKELFDQSYQVIDADRLKGIL